MNARLLVVLSVCLAAVLFAASSADAQAIFRVDKSATGANNGTSWQNAFTTIQPAIDAARSAGGGEVWVAGGPVGSPVYYSEPRNESWGGYLGSLVMKDNVQVYGGFEGWRGGAGKQETARSQRVLAQNVAVIDGTTSRGGAHAFHVVVFGRATEATVNARLDGFHITGGNASGVSGVYHTYRGGGIYNWQSAPDVVNCYIYGNEASVSGGGVANEAGATITANAQYINCVITSNTASRNVDFQGNPIRGGGGVFNNKSAPILTQCTITDNTTGVGGPVGPGMVNYGVNSGGIYNYSDRQTMLPATTPILLSSIVWGNTGTVGILNENAWAPSGNPPTILGPVNPMVATYSDIQGGYAGTGNLNTNPNFSGTFPFAYQITGAPCVDTGSSSITSDIRGVPRPLGAGRDMGAYEYSPTGPVAVCKAATVNLDAGCSATITVADINNGSSAQAGIWKLVASQTTFGSADIPSKPVVLTVTDILNRTATCTATVTVNDPILPVITSCPGDVLLNLDGTCRVAVPNFANLVTATDNCGIATKTQTPIAGTLVSVDTQVTMTVTDVGSNAVTRTAWVYVQDVTPPVITRSGSATVDVECGSTYTDAGATAADNCDGNLTGSIITNNPVNTAIIGSYTVTYNVTDSSGNPAAQVTRTVNVQDTIAPVITSCPGDQTLDLDGDCQVAIPDLVAALVATDSCGIASTVQNPAAGTLVSVDTLVTMTVTDLGGNTAQCTATISVQDVTAPVISLIGSSVINHQFETPFSDPGTTVADNCDTGLSVVVGGDTVDVNTIGDYTITYDVTDSAGNPAVQVTRLVRVRDTQSPYLLDVQVVDGWTVAVTFNKAMGVGVTDPLNYSVSGSGMGTLALNPESVVLDTGNIYLLSWPVCGDLSSQEMLLGGDITITVAPVVQDASGNTMDVGGNVMTDTGGAIGVAPVIDTCAADKDLVADENCQVIVPDLTAEMVASDNCSAVENLVITQDPAAGTLISVDTVVTLTVEDEAGNVSQCTATITILDTTPPAIIDSPDSVNAVLNTNCEALVPNMIPEVVAEDNCTTAGNLIITQDPPAGATIVEDTVVTITVEDEAGNSVQAQANAVVVDTMPPVITIEGDNPLVIECGEPVSLPGASADDNCDGDRPFGVSTPPALNLTNPQPGLYNVIYSATDTSGNTGTATLVVNVVDTGDPVVTIFGSGTLTVECGVPITTFPGASALDDCEGTLPVSPTGLGGLSTSNPAKGTYTVTYTASDSSGNTGSADLQVEVVDTTPPVITRLGAAFVYIPVGDPYTDAGAVASDACDGVLSGSILTVNPVDTNTVGLYQVTYDVADSEGLAAEQVIRNVWVGDMTEPDLINVNVESTLEIWVTFNRPMLETGPTGVLDPTNYTLSGSGQGTFNPIPDSVTSYGSLNRYILTWTRPDEMFNGGDITITVNPNVEDSEGHVMRLNTNTHTGGGLGHAPVITMNAGDETLECSVDEFTEAGATAMDNVDGEVTVVIGGDTVDDSVSGVYVITYDAVDAAGNASQKTRTVTVEDNAAPDIALIGAAAMELECGLEAYSEPGASALDACDGDLTDDILIGGGVNTGLLGVQTISYSVSDSMGNIAQVTREITVVDTTAPLITLLGNNPEVLTDGSDYVEAGAGAWDDCEGDLSALIDLTGDVANTNELALYELTYTVSDSSGNDAYAVRAVVVKPEDCELAYSLAVSPNPALLDANVTLTVTELPESCSVGDIHYTWMKDGEVVPIAPDASNWVLDAVGFEDAGSYSCVVSDASSAIETNAVVLVVEKGVPAVGLLGLAMAAAAIAGAAALRKRR